MKGKYSKPFKLVMALALVAGLVPILAAPAQACIEVDIDPIGGPVGTEVIVYYGRTYLHAWEFGNPAVAANSTIFGDIPVEHDMGRLREDAFVFTVPDVPPGDYNVRVIEATLAAYYDITFTVTTGEVIPCPHISPHLDPAEVKLRYLEPAFTPLPELSALLSATPFPGLTVTPFPELAVTPLPIPLATPAPTPTPAATAAPGRLWLWLTALLVVVVLVVWALVRQRRKAS